MADYRRRGLERAARGGDPSVRVRALRERLRCKGDEQSRGLVHVLDVYVSGRCDEALGVLDGVLSQGFVSDAQEVYNVVVPQADGFYLEDGGEVWRFYNVEFEGARWVEELSKVPVVEGFVTQEQVIPQLRGGSRRLPSAPRLYNLIGSLYRRRESPLLSQRVRVEVCRSGLAGLRWLLTSTAGVYNRKAPGVYNRKVPDEVVHDWDPDPSRCGRGVSVVLVGSHAWVREGSGLEAEMGALFGVRDLVEVKDVFHWFSGGYDPYLWRIDGRPKAPQKRAVVLGRDVDDDRFGIDVYGLIVGGRALGWSAQKISEK